MRIGLGILMAAVIAIATTASAQTTVDDFESYADTGALNTVYSVRGGAPLPGEAANLMSPGGADGSNQWMQITDGGFSFTMLGSNIITPPAGNYVFKFYWRNGASGGTPMRALKVSLNQGTGTANSVTLSAASAPSAVTDWTLYQSSLITLTNDPISIEITAANGANTDYNADFDQMILSPATNLPLGVSVSPDDSIYLSRTRSITATPSAGSGTFTKVEFDVNNDSTVDFTDTTPPYVFNWDTTGAIPVGTSGSVWLRTRVTDSNTSFADHISSFTIENEYNGRTSMVTNGDFSSFQGTGAAGNLPSGWVDYQSTVAPGNVTYGPDPNSHDTTAGQCLKITFAASDFTNRYAVRTIENTGQWVDCQSTYWGKGSSNRIYYTISTDAGATFVVATGTSAAEVNSSSWAFASGPPQSFSLTDVDKISLATHQFNAGDHFYDDITMEGLLVPPTSSVHEWNLY